MADKKISEVTPKGAQLEDDDLLIVSEFNGATYDTKSVTGINVRPYKTIMFAITQNGTSAPTVDYSYTGEVTQTFTLARTAVGEYTLTASSALFTANKTFITFTPTFYMGSFILGANNASSTVVSFYSRDSTDGSLVDTALDGAQLEIKIIK